MSNPLPTEPTDTAASSKPDTTAGSSRPVGARPKLYERLPQWANLELVCGEHADLQAVPLRVLLRLRKYSKTYSPGLITFGFRAGTVELAITNGRIPVSKQAKRPLPDSVEKQISLSEERGETKVTVQAKATATTGTEGTKMGGEAGIGLESPLTSKRVAEERFIRTDWVTVVGGPEHAPYVRIEAKDGSPVVVGDVESDVGPITVDRVPCSVEGRFVVVQPRDIYVELPESFVQQVRYYARGLAAWLFKHERMHLSLSFHRIVVAEASNEQ